jgi:NAD+ diphosphatase
MPFNSRIQPPDGSGGAAYWFVFQGDKLLVQRDGDRLIPLEAADASALGLSPTRSLYMGYLDGEEPVGRIDCYCAEIGADAPIPDGLLASGLRDVYDGLGDALWAVAGRAVQLLAWDRTHHFCGQCGAPTEAMPNERAKRCPQCGLIAYPRLSPAIIIAVTRLEAGVRQILLARNHRFPNGRYSVLAGFVEPGESLEDCAQREVGEEVGIQIKNIRYFGSQPWPFPNSLMVGFTAEYDCGDVMLEEAELADARWFTADALPNHIPPKMTIARKLIDWFIAQE